MKKNNYSLIRANEKRFAKRVIYQLRAQDPPPAWHNLIPFQFLFEYIRIRRAAGEFEENAMVVRRTALESALSMAKNQSPDLVRKNMQNTIREWLSRNNLFSQPLLEKQMALAEAYEAHFKTLLAAEGKTYEDLVRRGYRVPPKYREFLDKTARMEAAIDSLVCEMSFEAESERRECENRMEKKHNAFEKAREMEIDRVF